ncbi:MAG TPA: glycosyltransferase family A protein [Verrucomicrobiae bacterium]|nr:glycosyltransferase family A protein [Verrucomicrobiae bacterium]
MSTLEIILPVRNPTAVLAQTVRSLAAQTDRRFSVLLSDNHSTQGLELLEAAISELQAAGIETRRVRPPYELGRVEHWNWAHFESAAEWLKPVFMGDWLEPNYVAELRAALLGHPEARYVFASFVYHHGDSAPMTVLNPWAGPFHPAKKMEQIVLDKGMQFGPPSAAAYERNAFITIGGYPTTLPICADSLMFCTMASRFGALGLAEPLCHFNIHGARFSTKLPQQRRNTLRESITYYFMLAYRAWSERTAFSRIAFARLVAREYRAYFAKRDS